MTSTSFKIIHRLHAVKGYKISMELQTQASQQTSISVVKQTLLQFTEMFSEI